MPTLNFCGWKSDSQLTVRGQKIDKKASNVRDLHELFKIWIRPSLGVCLACSV